MAYTNSELATYTRISPNRNSPRNKPISKITIHHMAGVSTVEAFGNIVANPGRQMSSNYAIGNDGRIGLFCPESDRSWCSSSPANDHAAITIEVSNSKYGDEYGWPISNAAYESLIALCVDICKRNGIKKLEYKSDGTGTLTRHCDLYPTQCLPIERTELLTPSGWKSLKDIKIGDNVATVHIDNLGIVFDEVENIVPIKTQDTYITRDFEATSDHRVLYYNGAGRQYVGQYKELYDKPAQYYLPNAGYITRTSGLSNLGRTDIEFLVAVQADGHYMKDGDCRYGVEFHLSKDRKIKRLKKIFKIMNLDYKVCNQSDGTTKLRVYGKDIVEACEEYLNNKCFTWEWLNMNRSQVDAFFEAILQYDGCVANNSYCSSITENVDIVQAIAAINGIGSKITPDGKRIYFKKYRRSLGTNKRKRKSQQLVSCVTVRSGFILIRQHGRTTITGNCPGPWIKNHTNELCAKVNAQLNAINNKPIINNNKTSSQTTTTTSNKIKKGDLVTISSNATYYTGASIPSWVKSEKWYVSSISGDRAILGLNETKNRNIQSPVNTKFLTVVKVSTKKTYTVSLKSTDILYATAGGKTKGNVGTSGIFTIVEDTTVNGVKYGKLKSGAGWVKLSTTSTSTPIKKGDWVKVINNITYDGKKFTVYASKYKVLELNGKRAVISSDGKNVTCAINIANIAKV